MAQSAGLHEPEDRLTPDTIDRHRALASIQEELEAVDWYAQRVDATADAELAAVLAHNRDEEKEHAAMTLEWLRRRDPVARPAPPHLPVHLRLDPRARSRGGIGRRQRHRRLRPAPGSLGIGSLKGSER